MFRFKAAIDIIGINPYVAIPDRILKHIFKQSAKDKGPIPVCGTINNHPYKQTLLRYKGEWRLYINTTMLKNSPKRIGEIIAVTIEFDPRDRTISPHPKLKQALLGNEEANASFKSLSPSRKKEILRYIAALKTEKSVEENIKKTINFLTGKGRFVGRDKP